MKKMKLEETYTLGRGQTSACGTYYRALDGALFIHKFKRIGGGHMAWYEQIPTDAIVRAYKRAYDRSRRSRRLWLRPLAWLKNKCARKVKAGADTVVYETRKNERDTVNMSSKITKAEKAAASNPSTQAFSVLPYSVQTILRKAAEQDPSAIQYLNEDGQWKRATEPTFGANKIYRVHPDAATTESEIVRSAVGIRDNGAYTVTEGKYTGTWLSNFIAKADAVGIVYRSPSGNESQFSRIDLGVGTPVAVLHRG